MKVALAQVGIPDNLGEDRMVQFALEANVLVNAKDWDLDDLVIGESEADKIDWKGFLLSMSQCS